jgi:hypothetical protein
MRDSCSYRILYVLFFPSFFLCLYLFFFFSFIRPFTHSLTKSSLVNNSVPSSFLYVHLCFNCFGSLLFLWFSCSFCSAFLLRSSMLSFILLYFHSCVFCNSSSFPRSLICFCIFSSHSLMFPHFNICLSIVIFSLLILLVIFVCH